MTARFRMGNRTGLIPIEIFALVMLTLSALGLAYGFLRGPSRTPPPGTAVERAEMATQSLARRIRRDVHWARSFKIEDKGHRLSLEGPEKEVRTYTYLPGKLAVSAPTDENPAQSSEVEGAQFREFLFVATDERTVKYVVAAFPQGRSLSKKASKRDRDLTRVICGSASLEGAVARKAYPHWTF